MTQAPISWRGLRQSPWPWLCALLGLVALVYWPGLNGGFAFDDYPNIVFNEPLHVTSLHWDAWLAAVFSSMSSELQRPLAMLTFAINCYFTGIDPWPMKLTNIGIHLLNTLLVYGLARAVLRSVDRAQLSGRNPDFAALLVASFWALAPINLMAVLFIVQRMESLCHAFVFAGLWLYVCGRLRQRSGQNGWAMILAGLVPCTALGLLVKESAVLLPLYAVCIEVCLFQFKGQGDVRDRRLVWMFVLGLLLPALLGGAWLLQRALEPSAFGSRNFDLGQRLLTEPRVVFDYLHWTVLPDINKLSLYHDDYPVSRSLWQPASTLPAMLALSAVLLLALILAVRRKRPLMVLGIFWFFAAQALTATFIPLELVFEHRNYFASLGIMLALTDLLLFLPNTYWRNVGVAAAALLLIWFGSLTELRAREWSNPLSFALSEASKHPMSPRATYHLGQTYVSLSHGKPGTPFTEAAFEALERARRVPDGNIMPAQGLLLLASQTGRPLKAEWWQEIEDRLGKHTIGPQERGSLAALTECDASGKCHFPVQDMERMFAAALSRGNDPEIINIYASYTLHVLDRPQLALGLWEIAVQLRPQEPIYRESLIKLLIAMDRDDEARTEIKKLRTLGRLGQYVERADEMERRLPVRPH